MCYHVLRPLDKALVEDPMRLMLWNGYSTEIAVGIENQKRILRLEFHT